METYSANIERGEDQTFLNCIIGEKTLKISLTDDKPNAIKSVFNELISELKKGKFNFKLEDDKDDLYFHICKEYIDQLNSDLSSVYQELDDYGLLAGDENVEEIETTEDSRSESSVD